MRIGYQVDLYNAEGHLLAHTLREHEPTGWVFGQMAGRNDIDAAVITEAVVKGDDLDPEAGVVRVLGTRALLREVFDAAVESGTIRFDYNPLKELSTMATEGVGKPPNEAGYTVAERTKRLEDFLATLSEGERMILRGIILGGE